MIKIMWTLIAVLYLTVWSEALEINVTIPSHVKPGHEVAYFPGQNLYINRLFKNQLERNFDFRQGILIVKSPLNVSESMYLNLSLSENSIMTKSYHTIHIYVKHNTDLPRKNHNQLNTFPFSIHKSKNTNLLWSPIELSRRRRQIPSDVHRVSETKDTTQKLFSVERNPSGTQYTLKSHTQLLTITSNSDVYLKPGQSLDYESEDQREISLEVEITRNDKIESRTITIIVVNVNDEKPEFKNFPLPMLATVPINNPARDKVIYELKGVDPDGELAALEYSINSGNERGMFKINRKTGQIMVNGKKTFTMKDRYDLTVSVIDTAAATQQQRAQATVNIVVGSRPPQFEKTVYVQEMRENFDTSHTVVTIKAKSFQDASITYSFPSDMINDGDHSLFSIKTDTSYEPARGIITVRRKVDYELASKFLYTLKVIAVEGSLSSSVTVKITLTDVNDNQPKFPSALYQKGIEEDFPTTRPVLVVSVSDADRSPEFRRITFTVTNDSFTIKKISDNQASIYINKKLDYEKTQTYEFKVRAIDSLKDPKIGEANVRIDLINVNDEEPKFLPPLTAEYTVKSLVRLVHRVRASDADGDDVKIYFKGKRTKTDAFTIDPDTGYITVDPISLNEQKQVYNLSLLAVDDGKCCKKSSTPHEVAGNFIIKLVGLNKFQPSFKKCNDYKPEIAEGPGIGRPVITVSATDEDFGDSGKISYKVESRNKFFTIDSLGTITTAHEIDLESIPGNTIPVTVIATDNGKPTKKGICTIEVKVTDVNDNAPKFISPANVQVSRTIKPNNQVHTVIASDADSGVNAEISLAIDPTSEYFRIRKDGSIIVQKSLENAKNPLIITVTATDQGKSPKKTTQILSFQLMDSQTLLPSWVQIEDSYSIEERVASKQIAKISAKSNNKHSQILFEIVAGNDQKLFTLYKPDTLKNEAVLLNKEILDYEAQPTHLLTIKAQARAEHGNVQDLIITKVVTINVVDRNDEMPRFSGGESIDYFNITENFASTTVPVATISAEDKDSSAKFRDLSFTIIKEKITLLGEFSTDLFRVAKVSENKADIFVLKEFDREDPRIFKDKTPQNFYIQIEVSDQVESAIIPPGPNKAVHSFRVEILDQNDNPPRFQKREWSVTIREDHPRDKQIQQVLADDIDSASKVKYSLQSRFFTIDEDTGVVTPNVRLDYEDRNQREFRLKLVVTDLIYNDTAYLIVTVEDVNDENPVFTKPQYVVRNVEEGDPTVPIQEKLLTTVSATDGDYDRPKETWRYSLVDSLGNSLRINEVTGQVYLVKNLDRDLETGGAPERSVQVKVIDEPDNPRQGLADLLIYLNDINDNRPVFQDQTLKGHVKEHSVNDVKVSAEDSATQMKVNARDYDFGPNNQVSYQFKDHDGTFGITKDGKISVKTSDKQKLDREKQSKYYITVLAIDGGRPALTATGTLTITLDDINDNAPSFKQPLYKATMSEGAGKDSSIMTVTATDPDTSDKLKFGIEKNDYFYIDGDPSSQYVGLVKVFKKVDYEDKAQRYFKLQVTVNDGKTTATTSVEISVSDYNDNEPVLAPPYVTRSLKENDNTLSIQFSANDKDSGENAKFSYSIDRQTDENYLFHINEDGRFTLAPHQKMDYEEKTSHTIHVLATDKGLPPLTGTATIVINLQDVNDNAPELAKKYNIQFREGEDPPIVQPPDFEDPIRATDRDSSGNKGPYEFKLDCQDGNICDNFKLKFTSGKGENDGYAQIESRKKFDREKQKYYYLPIVITDSGKPEVQSGTSTLTVTIGDTNDNRHADGTKTVTLLTYKKLPSGHRVSLGNVYVEDPDDWDLDFKTFTKTSVNPEIEVDSETGAIVMVKPLAIKQHKLTVNVYDKKFDLTAVGTVYVKVREISEEAVQSSGSVRLTGITAADFVKGGTASLMEKFRNLVATKLNVPPKNVEIFSVMDRGADTDIRFAAHGSPWKQPDTLNGIISQHWSEFEGLGVTIGMVPVDECVKETCESGCYNKYVVSNIPNTVNSNDTAFVGVSTRIEATCQCKSSLYDPGQCELDYCFNGGYCYIDDWKVKRCFCRAGFDGPRCQKTKISFNGDGWATFPSLSQCSSGTTSLEFITTQETGLLFYNGPHKTRKDTNDYIELRLQSGKARLSIDHGTGHIDLTVNSKPLNDGQWHRVDIVRSGKDATIIVDQCKSSTFSDPNTGIVTEDRSSCEKKGTTWGKNSALNVFTRLQVGGTMISPPFPDDGIAPPFKGCIKNLKHNGQLYDLSPRYHKNAAEGCPGEDKSCLINNQPKCGKNGYCVGSFVGGSVCVCKPRYKGIKCDEETTVVEYRKDSYIRWQFLGKTSLKENQIQMTFRTRQPSGLLFQIKSGQGNKYIELELKNKILRARYDLGRGEFTALELDKVLATNGQWHTVYFRRNGKYASLSMDSEEGPYFTETWGYSNSRYLFEIDKGSLVSGAEIGTSVPRRDLKQTCMTDIRYDGKLLPVVKGTKTNAATIQSIPRVFPGCSRDDCKDKVCKKPHQICFPLWEEFRCKCKSDYKLEEDKCVLCCQNGGTCQVDGSCICPAEFTGPQCATVAEIRQPLSISTGGIVAIIVTVFLALLLVLIFFIYIRFSGREKEPMLDSVDSYYDVKEYAFSYDDEGAGEEDQTGYDLNLLKVPINREINHKPWDGYQMQQPVTGPNNVDMADFIDKRLGTADSDGHAPPHDSVRQFIYEGGGSTAGSLSSLNTSTSNEDQDFDYLNDWGPKFSKLAEMYGGGVEQDE